MRTGSIARPSSPGAVAGSEKLRRLCIVSRDPLKCGEFVEALQMLIGPDEELEIIVDRRSSRSAAESEPDDRRRHQHLDVLLRMNGFVIVPASVTVPSGSLSLDTDDDRERLESILEFESQREDRRRPWWIIGGLFGLAGLVVAVLAFLPAARTLVSRPRLDPPPPVERTDAPPVVAQVQTPPVTTEIPSPSTGEVTPAPSREVTPAPNPESRTSTATGPEIPVRPDVARPTESREATPARDADPPPRPTPAPPREVSPPTTSVPPPTTARRDLAPSGFAGLPRVELVRRPAPGRGDEAYAVRVSDAIGRPVSGAEVSLLLTLAGGTVLDIPLDSGSEPGVYHGTAPPVRAAPTNLRVRVVMSDKRVEVPVTR